MSLLSRLRSLVARSPVALLRPSEADVLVVRIDGDARRANAIAELRAAGMWPRLAGGPMVIVVPAEASVRAEAPLKPKEDLGYRETRNVGVDAGAEPGDVGRHACGAPGSRP